MAIQGSLTPLIICAHWTIIRVLCTSGNRHSQSIIIIWMILARQRGLCLVNRTGPIIVVWYSVLCPLVSLRGFEPKKVMLQDLGRKDMPSEWLYSCSFIVICCGTWHIPSWYCFWRRSCSVSWSKFSHLMFNCRGGGGVQDITWEYISNWGAWKKFPFKKKVFCDRGCFPYY